MTILDNPNAPFVNRFQTDIAAIKEKVNLITEEEWTAWTLRQVKFNGFHRATNSFPLMWNQTNHNINQQMWTVTQPVIDQLEQFYDSTMNSCIYVRLPSGRAIPTHFDKGMLTNVHRNHIPIISNDRVTFLIGNERAPWQEGQCYEINNPLAHSVANRSTVDRVHLIIDIWHKHAKKS